MKVKVDIDYVDVESDSGHEVEGLCVTCERCGHSVEVMGIYLSSARYAAVKLCEECPKNENNYYDVDWWA